MSEDADKDGAKGWEQKDGGKDSARNGLKRDGSNEQTGRRADEQMVACACTSSFPFPCARAEGCDRTRALGCAGGLR